GDPGPGDPHGSQEADPEDGLPGRCVPAVDGLCVREGVAARNRREQVNPNPPCEVRPMKFLKSTLAAAAMLGTMAVTPAWADFSFTSECGGQSFSTCASGSLATSYDAGTGLTTVTIDITHEGTNGELFKAVGLIGVPAGS